MTVKIGRFGVWSASWFYADLEPAQLGEIGADLEEIGYRTLWVGVSPASLHPAAHILAATSEFSYATGIVNVWSEPVDQVRANYLRLAAQYPDRLLLGIGAGHPEATQEYQKPFDRVVEYLDALTAGPDGVPAENITLAALGPRVLRLATARTAGPHPYLVTPEYTAQARELVGPDTQLAVEHKVVLETDPAKARAIGRATVEYYLGLSNYLANLRRLGFTEDDFANGGSDRLIDALVAWGDPDTVAARLYAHLDAGADHVSVQMLVERNPAGGGRLPTPELRTLGKALFG